MFLRNQTGVALLAVIFFLVVMAFVGVIFISLSSNSMTQSVNEVYSTRALYVAEGGLERAGRYLLKRENGTCTTCSCTSITGAPFTNIPLGNGQFAVTGGLSNTNPPTTLFSTTSATDVTIPVVSTVNYAPFGQIMIDREKMNYVGQGSTAAACAPYSAPCFTGVFRGADGTAAVTHINGTRIAQTQCLLTSTGGVPTINTGTNQRVVSQADVVQDGWTVGDPGNGGQRPLTIHWNGSVWTAQNNSALNINQTLRSVNCVSAVDCWAVGNPGNGGLGQHPLTIHWNGSVWTAQNNSALNINQTLWSVNCVSAVDCWAVGDPGSGGLGQRPLTIHWSSVSGIFAWRSQNNSSLNINRSLFS
ncbi:MAG: hypothetical protein ACYDBV_13255, partial [Nitrospiria bacterium]